MGRLGSESTRPNGGCQEHAPILTIICDRDVGKGLILCQHVCESVVLVCIVLLAAQLSAHRTRGRRGRTRVAEAAAPVADSRAPESRNLGKQLLGGTVGDNSA